MGQRESVCVCGGGDCERESRRDRGRERGCRRENGRDKVRETVSGREKMGGRL